MNIEKIVVFCGASLGFQKVYEEKAIALGTYFAKNNIELVYGAGKIGLMGAVADAVLVNKGKVTGIIPELLAMEEVIHPDITTTVITKTMSERKFKMSKLADAYITLPGGFGTLDELFEVLTLQQLYIEKKPVGLLNVNGFYDAILQQLDVMIKEGLLKLKNRDMLIVADTIPDLISKMEAYKAPVATSIINKVVK